MHAPSVEQLIPVLRTAIGPVCLISGVGLLPLTRTNRLGRAIDRARLLTLERPGTDPGQQARISGQREILWGRPRLFRHAIALASMSALPAPILIMALFLTALWQIETAWLIALLFIHSMACLVGSLTAFIHDIQRSLAALGLELAMEGHRASRLHGE